MRMLQEPRRAEVAFRHAQHAAISRARQVRSLGQPLPLLTMAGVVIRVTLARLTLR